MVSYTFKVNQQSYTVEASPETPLLWVLRDELGLTGTKYSCGVGECGACTVHLDGEAVRSCNLPISRVGASSITTIEGLSSTGDHPLQLAWIEGQVPQCGYCQPGQIMQAAALLLAKPQPTQVEIVETMSAVLCRCGTYQRILGAIQSVVETGGAA
ncbi:MAG: 2Fe-2S iron-sulfur cluster binding domain-containing protein [Anaerolineales bacterium]|nr:2Fe-2S iron-sulfur cluster binding domain-containing protein [Anaerolineales bacterium]